MATVEVTRRGPNNDLPLALQLSAGVVVVAILFLSRSPKTTQTPLVLDFQVLVSDLPSTEQRTVRAVHEGVIEVERVRSAGTWPSVDALANDGVPPFANDPLDVGHYVWRRVVRGLTTSYVGTPASTTTTPTLFVVFQEPAAGDAAYSKPAVDEVHHELADGTPIHATLWKHAGAVADDVIDNPLAAGCLQVLVAPIANL